MKTIKLFALLALILFSVSANGHGHNKYLKLYQGGIWECNADSETGKGYGASQNQFEAKALAFDRCKHDSDKNNKCEIKQCNHKK